MLVTKENYIEGARVKFTPSAFKHFKKDFKEELDKEYILPPSENIRSFSISNVKDIKSIWIELSPRGLIEYGACISEFTHINTKGYFLEYIEIYDIEDMKEGELETGMHVTTTTEFIESVRGEGGCTVNFPKKFYEKHYGIVKEPMDNESRNKGIRHYVDFYDENNIFIENTGIHCDWLKVYESNIFNIDNIIELLNKLEDKLKK